MRNKVRSTIGTTDLLAAPLPPMLVDDFIVRRGITGISSDPGVGKTFLALEIIRNVVQQNLFLERCRTKRASVLFVGQDCSEAEYARQARKVFQDEPLTATFERTGRVDEQGNPIVETLKPFEHIAWLLHENVNMANPADVADLVRLAKSVPNLAYDPETPIDYERVIDEQGRVTWEPVYDEPMGVGLIVFDTWSKCNRARENDNDEQNRAFDGLRLLSETCDAAILLLHHHSYGNEYNSGSRWRGASSQLGALDAHFELKKGKGDRIHVNVHKYRGIRPPDLCIQMTTTETTCDFDFVGQSGDGGVIPDEWLKYVMEFASMPGIRNGFKTKQLAEYLIPIVGEGLAPKTVENRAGAIVKQLTRDGLLKAAPPWSWVLNDQKP